jgi:hypothetical protein
MKKQVFQTHKEAVKRALEELGVHKCTKAIQQHVDQEDKTTLPIGRVVLITRKGQGASITYNQ